MANPYRGEISATLDGVEYTLCLTLGALAELEARLGGQDILSLAQLFESGRITAREAICVIGAGLRGGGNDISDARVALMRIDGGVAGYLSLVVALLQAAFGADAPVNDKVREADPSFAKATEGKPSVPFPGGV